MAAVGESQMQNLVMMFLQGLYLHAGNTVKEPLELPVPGNSRSWDAVVGVEQLPPEELIPGHGKPLMQEDLQHQAVRKRWPTGHPDILSMYDHLADTSFFCLFFLNRTALCFYAFSNAPAKLTFKCCN
uniref:Uncharacterized protein n=1 Tax=Paramormyrops kingsleyae TaxID=1676925 RepID=A0A3B3TE86_9TELE